MLSYFHISIICSFKSVLTIFVSSVIAEIDICKEGEYTFSLFEAGKKGENAQCIFGGLMLLSIFFTSISNIGSS